VAPGKRTHPFAQSKIVTIYQYMLNPFEGKTKREIMIEIGQDPGEDLRNSKHVDFNTNLFGDKSKKNYKIHT